MTHLEEFEAELLAEYGMGLVEYEELLEEYGGAGESKEIKPFYGAE